LILGILVGWLVELAVDYRFWRREAKATAARQAQQQAALDARAKSLDEGEAALAARDEELGALQSSLAAKDAELLALAKRTDDRAEEVTRLEQAMDKRRADLDRMGLTLNEREKDIAARNQTLQATEADVATRLASLQASEADVSRRTAVVSNRESAMQNWEARILARENELNDKEGDLVRQAATATGLRASLEAAKELMSRRYKTPEGADDLQAIEGIGPKIANLLRNADIKTFERLSETPLGELTRILEAGGPRFGLADPMSWAEQASCLVNRDFVAFEELKESLIAGVRRDEIARQPAVAVAVHQTAAAEGASAADSGSKDAATVAVAPGEAHAGELDSGEADAGKADAGKADAAGAAVREAAVQGAAQVAGDQDRNPRPAAGDATPADGSDAGGDAGTRPRGQADGAGPGRALVSHGPLFEAAAFSRASGSDDPDGSGSR
jgi:predicted flap endonuclease-1-like 5' DNA nuclease